MGFVYLVIAIPAAVIGAFAATPRPLVSLLGPAGATVVTLIAALWFVLWAGKRLFRA